MVLKWLNLLMGIYVGECSSMFYPVILFGNFLLVGLLILQCLLCIGWGLLGLKIVFPDLGSPLVMSSHYEFGHDFFSVRPSL